MSFLKQILIPNKVGYSPDVVTSEESEIVSWLATTKIWESILLLDTRPSPSILIGNYDNPLSDL